MESNITAVIGEILAKKVCQSIEHTNYGCHNHGQCILAIIFKNKFFVKFRIFSVFFINLNKPEQLNNQSSNVYINPLPHFCFFFFLITTELATLHEKCKQSSQIKKNCRQTFLISRFFFVVFV